MNERDGRRIGVGLLLALALAGALIFIVTGGLRLREQVEEQQTSQPPTNSYPARR